jgi:hypothetical protein
MVNSSPAGHNVSNLETLIHRTQRLGERQIKISMPSLQLGVFFFESPPTEKGTADMTENVRLS